jgi:hypothetical protein
VHSLPRDATRRRYDVILLSQVLSELDLELEPNARVEAHRILIAGLLRERLTPAGILVVVEPALRARSRHLQQVRAALLAQQTKPIVVAPCLHAGACPMLVRDTDWCHEDLAIDLPPWLAPLAKSAGLRWEGLTFSAMTFATRGPSLESEVAPRAGQLHLRIVSAPLISKGKHEVIVCGAPLDTGTATHGARLGRLDRHRSATTEAFDGAGRGDILAIEGALDEKHRLGPTTRVHVVRE